MLPEPEVLVAFGKVQTDDTPEQAAERDRLTRLLAEDHGWEWVERHRGLLDAQWEWAKWIGLV